MKTAPRAYQKLWKWRELQKIGGHGNLRSVFSPNFLNRVILLQPKIEQMFEGSRGWEEFEGMGNQRNWIPENFVASAIFRHLHTS